MSSDRYPRRDFRLERLGGRDGMRPAQIGEAAHVSSFASGTTARDLRAAYEALIDAVFTGPGAAEWLHLLKVAVAARVAKKATVPHESAQREAS